MQFSPRFLRLAAFVLGLVCVQTGSGCAGNNADGSSSEAEGVGGRSPQYGDYTKSEIDAVRASIAKVTYPAKEGTVARLLLRPVQPMPVEFLHGMADEEKKGRVGGNIVEYWLNREYVLKVATAYYTEGGAHPSREEWAVILSCEEWRTVERPIYPTAVKFRVPKSVAFAAGGQVGTSAADEPPQLCRVFGYHSAARSIPLPANLPGPAIVYESQVLAIVVARITCDGVAIKPRSIQHVDFLHMEQVEIKAGDVTYLVPSDAILTCTNAGEDSEGGGLLYSVPVEAKHIVIDYRVRLPSGLLPRLNRVEVAR